MKDKSRVLIGYGLIGVILMFSLYGVGSSIASGRFEGMHWEYEDDRYERGYQEGSEILHRRLMLRQESDQYRQECGDCHMAYPAGLLPSQSWSKIMAGLEDHFGENAELDEPEFSQIKNYLQQSSSRYGSGRWFTSRGYTPVRITELPYFQHEHDEIPARFVKGNAKVNAISQCNACHQGAEKGYFDEDNVIIPGVGRWDD